MSKTEAKDDKISIGINKDLYNAFHWYRKAAENGDIDAQFNLANLYRQGEGTEKNLEKAFYWYQKVAESNKVNFSKNKAVLCNRCKQPYINYQWCQQCNSKQLQWDFLNWTSKNEYNDKFIQEAQLNAKLLLISIPNPLL